MVGDGEAEDDGAVLDERKSISVYTVCLIFQVVNFACRYVNYIKIVYKIETNIIVAILHTPYCTPYSTPRFKR